jgi:death-on-curing protein
MATAIHEAQVREHGGGPGVRDNGLLESALARPQHKFRYAPRTHISVLAAADAFGIAKNHPFVDGNKRTAFMVAYTFLGLNGWDLDVAEPEVVTIVEALAASRVSEGEFAVWIRQSLIKSRN